MYNTSALLYATTTFLLLIISFFTTTTSNNTFSTTPSPPSTVTIIDGRWPPLPPPALWIVVIVVLLLCTCSLLCGACCCDWCQCIGSVVFSPVESAGLKIEAEGEDVSVKGVVLRRSGSIRLSAQVASPARRTKTTTPPQKNSCHLFSPLNEVFFGAATCPQSQKTLQSAAVRRRRSASLKRCKVGSLKVDKRAGSGKVVVAVGHRKGQRSTSSATSRAAAASRRRRRLSPAASSSSSFSTAFQSKS